MIETPAAQFACRLFFVGERAVVAVSGDVDVATVPEMERRINEALALPITGIRVDLGGVTFFDGSGLALLAHAQAAAHHLGIGFALAAVPREVMRVLEVTGLTERFRFREYRTPRLPAGAPRSGRATM